MADPKLFPEAARRQAIANRQRHLAAVRQAWARGPVTRMPGFDESLRLLVEDEKYCLTDVALMFGLTRERVRQLCKKRGISHPDRRGSVGLRAVRVWDDASNRFRPVSRSVVSRARYREGVEQRRADYRVEVEQRRARVIAAVRALRERLGDEPSWIEVYLELNLGPAEKSAQACPRIVGYWSRLTALSTREATAEIRAAAEWKPRRRGRPRRKRRYAGTSGTQSVTQSTTESKNGIA